MRHDLAGERLHGGGLLLERAGAEHGAHHARPASHQLPQVERRLGAAAGPDDHDPPLDREREEIGVEVRRADELEDDVGAALCAGARPRARRGRSPSRRAAPPAPAAPPLRTVASTRAPETAAICTAAVPTPPLAPLTTRSSPGRSSACVITASCAVTKTSGTAAAASSSSHAGNGRHVALVDEHPIGEPASADDPEDPVTGGECARASARGDHRPGHLDAGNVGRRTGRSRVAPLALREVGRVQPCVADGDEDVVARRDGIGPLDEDDDLVAAGTAEDDCSHAHGERMRRRAARSLRLRDFRAGPWSVGFALESPGGPRCSQLSVPESLPTIPLAGLEIRETPEPTPADGWEIIEVRAAALNHHDVWSACVGVGVTEDDLPVVLGTRRRRRHGGRARGRRPCRARERRSRGRTRRSPADFHVFSERGVARNAGPADRRADPQSRAEARVALVRRGGLPADRVPDRVPDALHSCRPAARPVGARPGRRRRGRDGGGAARARSRPHVYVTSRSEEKRARALELGAARAFEPGSRLPSASTR